MPKSATVNRPTPFKESSDKAVTQNAKQIVWASIYEDSKSSSATTDRMRQMAAKTTFKNLPKQIWLFALSKKPPTFWGSSR